MWEHAELHRNILDVFNECGVQILTPAYEAQSISLCRRQRGMRYTVGEQRSPSEPRAEKDND